MSEVRARGSIFGKCLPARYVLAILGSIGMAIIYGLKVNLSVTMVAMLNHTAIGSNSDTHPNATPSCPSPGQKVVLEDGPFNWSGSVQGTILSCYFWGYLVSQIPGGRIAETFSAKWVMFIAVVINVLCTIFTPLMTKIHYSGLIVMRVVEGIGAGATFPAMHCLIAAWAPPNERFVMSTIIYVGTSLGTAISILISGVIANLWGWEWVFYSMGGLSCIWLILWTILVEDTPNLQRFISPAEREMIITSLGGQSSSEHETKHMRVPWRKVFTSVPFWAILVAHCCSNFGWYMFLIEIPFYMKQVLNFDVAKNATFSALPYLPMFIFSIILGKTLDTLKTKEKISTTVARKIATAIASVIPAICLVSLCFIGCDHFGAVAIMTVGIVGIGGMFSGFLSNHIDIAPNFAGTLVALTNTMATLPGIIVPYFVSAVTEADHSIDSWRIIFGVTITLFIVEFVVFTVFGSGEEQSWNKPEETHNTEATPLRNKKPN